MKEQQTGGQKLNEWVKLRGQKHRQRWTGQRHRNNKWIMFINPRARTLFWSAKHTHTQDSCVINIWLLHSLWEPSSVMLNIDTLCTSLFHSGWLFEKNHTLFCLWHQSGYMSHSSIMFHHPGAINYPGISTRSHAQPQNKSLTSLILSRDQSSSRMEPAPVRSCLDCDRVTVQSRSCMLPCRDSHE